MPKDARHPDLCDLRRFGLALARDDRFAPDRDAAEALVERLIRQASMEIVDFARSSDQGRQSDRVRAFGQFIRLYRRHIRRLACEQGEAGSEARGQGRGSSASMGVVAAVRMLPLELREALLIVALARFTHQDAALTLDIPLAALIDRLTLARERLAALTRKTAGAGAPDPARRSVAHLRLVK